MYERNIDLLLLTRAPTRTSAKPSKCPDGESMGNPSLCGVTLKQLSHDGQGPPLYFHILDIGERKVTDKVKLVRENKKLRIQRI